VKREQDSRSTISIRQDKNPQIELAMPRLETDSMVGLYSDFEFFGFPSSFGVRVSDFFGAWVLVLGAFIYTGGKLKNENKEEKGKQPQPAHRHHY
jgi:hypothetical protein